MENPISKPKEREVEHIKTRKTNTASQLPPVMMSSKK